MSNPILVVGAGFAGACVARILAERGYAVKVIDRRDHIGGNAYDFVDENGIRRHRYGPHLFHTNNEAVVQWLSQFGAWVKYEHRVRARLSTGDYVPLPINIDTINTFFGSHFTSASEVEAHLEKISIPIKNPKNAAEYLASKIGRDLTDTFFRPYTKKMWALDLEEMDASVVKRIPLRYDSEDRYFPNDDFQILPVDGYTSIFKNILDHSNIQVKLGLEYDRAMSGEVFHTFNSMPIDEYFDFEFGHLPYRSIKFHHSTTTEKFSAPWATTNFTDSGPLTRETYWHMLPHHLVEDTGRYTHTREEPCDYRENNMERYYPVKTADGRYDNVFQLYREKATSQPHITFIGRCGTYQYLDMHQVINQSLAVANRWVAEQ